MPCVVCCVAHAVFVEVFVAFRCISRNSLSFDSHSCIPTAQGTLSFRCMRVSDLTLYRPLHAPFPIVHGKGIDAVCRPYIRGTSITVGCPGRCDRARHCRLSRHRGGWSTCCHFCSSAPPCFMTSRHIFGVESYPMTIPPPAHPSPHLRRTRRLVASQVIQKFPFSSLAVK